MVTDDEVGDEGMDVEVAVEDSDEEGDDGDVGEEGE